MDLLSKVKPSQAVGKLFPMAVVLYFPKQVVLLGYVIVSAGLREQERGCLQWAYNNFLLLLEQWMGNSQGT